MKQWHKAPANTHYPAVYKIALDPEHGIGLDVIICA